jgi:thymidylate kinase
MSTTYATSSPEPDLTEVVTAVFTAWRQQNIAFVVLRNYERLPQFTGHDIDVLVHPRDLALAEHWLVAAARSAGYLLSNRAEFATVSFFFFHPETLVQIQFDLFTSLSWRGFGLVETATVLAQRTERGLFAVPHPAHEAVNNLLTRLLYHGYVKDKYKPGIQSAFAAHSEACADGLREMFGAGLSGQLTGWVREGNWAAVEAATHRLRRRLVCRRLKSHGGQTAVTWVCDAVRLMRRLWRSPGLMIVILGADGSGKSTAAASLMAALNGTFIQDKSLHVHWKPAVFLRRRRKERPPTRDPQAQPPRGRLASALALAWHWTEFLAGAVLQFFPVRFRAGLVLVERHHYDFFVDSRRYRLRSPGAVARFAFRCQPAPDLVFLLDAPAEVLHARKPELSLEETHRQREAYLKLVCRLRQGRVIDATQPQSVVVQEMLQKTLRFVEQRRRRRHPVPEDSPLVASPTAS